MYLLILLVSFLACAISENAPSCYFPEVYKIPAGKNEFLIHPEMPQYSKDWQFYYEITAGLQSESHPYIALRKGLFLPGTELIINCSKLPANDYILKLFILNSEGKRADCAVWVIIEDSVPVIERKEVAWVSDQLTLIPYIYLSVTPINLPYYHWEQIYGNPFTFVSLGGNQIAFFASYPGFYSFRVTGSNSIGNSTPAIISIHVGFIPRKESDLNSSASFKSTLYWTLN